MKYRPLNEALSQMNFPVESPNKKVPQERISKKEMDIFCRDVLERHPEIQEMIEEQMEILEERGVHMPVLHITSRAIRDVHGNEMSTHFVEHIREEGFRPRDTNVGAFIRRENSPVVAQPNFFKTHPEEFIKSLRLFLQRYIHHGLRTNKNVLGDARGTGVGVPTMIILDGGVTLEKGSDRDDHYILKDGASPDQIIGIIDLDERCQSISHDSVAYVARVLLEKIHAYYGAVELV